MSFETTVTIKYGKGYDESWAVFKGSNSDVKDAIQDYFEMPVEGLTLNEVVLNATKIAQGGQTAVRTIGGTAIKGSSASTPTPATPPADEAQAGGDAWSQAESSTPAAPEPPAENPLLAQIAAAGSVDALRRLYAENGAEFGADAELLAAWKARGKALSGNPA